MTDELYAYVRRHNYESYIAALLTKDPAAQRHVMAVLALRCELEHILHATREPMMGLMRLAWWREKIAEIYQSTFKQKQPTLEAIDIFVSDRQPPKKLLDGLLDAAGDAVEGKEGGFEPVLRELIGIAIGGSPSKTLSFLDFLERKRIKKASKNKGDGIGWLPFRALLFDLLTK